MFSTGVAGPTDYAAECSFVNDVFQKQICKGAVFVPSSTAGDDNCFLKGSPNTFSKVPGDITVILMNIFSNGNNSTCVPGGFSARNSSKAVDTTALIASITETPVTITQPPYAISTGGGGEYSTYVSHGETDSAGVYHYSWYYMDDSPSSWYAIYATSWSCTHINTVTIVTPRTNISSAEIFSAAGSSAISTTEVTTIIVGSMTTIISGTNTIVITGGGGGGGWGQHLCLLPLLVVELFSQQAVQAPLSDLKADQVPFPPLL